MHERTVQYLPLLSTRRATPELSISSFAPRLCFPCTAALAWCFPAPLPQPRPGCDVIVWTALMMLMSGGCDTCGLVWVR
jgi:hypothetical protein